MLETTLVVITADHGEELGEHGVYDHGYTLYRPALQVPLIVVAPGRPPEARRVAAPVSLRDIPATIVDAAGVARGAPFQGTSLAFLWNRASETRADAPLLFEVDRVSGQPDWFPASKGDMKALLYRGVKYIRNGDGSEELYDGEHDPWERRNLASQSEYRSIVGEYRLRLKGLVR